MSKLDPRAIQRKRGTPTPLGASRIGKGINFALFSENATQVTLCLFSPFSKYPFAEIPLDPELHKTGEVWHILLIGLPSDQLDYGFKIAGPNEVSGNLFNPKKIVIDPYAKGLNTGHQWGHAELNQEEWEPRGKVILEDPFDWQGAKSPKIPLEELVIYEMHVRSFTQHASAKTKNPGTFLGILEKIPYLKNLGINAIELMPIFEFNECENQHIDPKTGKKLKNLWGYSSINFFSPMNRFSSSSEWTGAMNDFRTLVREMHKNGIEVYLDVVYNHTAEGGKKGPFLSFKGIDNRVYYILNPQGDYIDFSGCGNTLNSNHPVVAQLILDSLRYWTSQMHVDGFRFDLASCLTRGQAGTPLAKPPVITAMIQDPILSDVKMIAEAWDAGGLYQVGSFASGGRWFEWNGKYRDVIRRFIKGTDGQCSAFATAISGSQDLYGNGRKPYHSINFVTAHDGFTLRDLVSYQDKHNENNAEDNRDGSDQNDSWNCGKEGVTDNKKILSLRERQMRNFHTALMVSVGTPMVLMGDEYGHTKKGNNNTYCQDNPLNWFLWDQLPAHADFVRFHKLMIHFRKTNRLLHRKEFLTDEDVTWHGQVPKAPNWGVESRFIAYTLNDLIQFNSLYIAFNPNFERAQIQLPEPPGEKKWYRVVDTSAPPPFDFCENPTAASPLKHTYDLCEYAALIAKAL